MAEEEDQAAAQAAAKRAQEEAARQKEAAAKAQATSTVANPLATTGTLIGAAPTTGTVTGISTPPAPLLSTPPVISPPQAIDVNPPLTHQGAIDARVMQVAENYRNLPVNATPEQRAQVKAEYADTLMAKEAAAREAGWAPPALQPTVEDRRIAQYNTFLERQGINPYTIGRASMNAQGGLDVASIPEETKANWVANQAAETLQGYIDAERQARRNARGLKAGKEKDAAEASVVEAKLAKEQYALKSGAIDPRNPTVGMNVANMRRVADAVLQLTRDPSSLAALSQQRRQADALLAQQQQRTERTEQTEQTEQERLEASRARELREIEARNREEAERFAEDMERRKNQMFYGNYAYNY